MKEKEALSLGEIKKQLSNKDDEGKKELLKEFLKDENYKDLKKELLKELVSKVTKKPTISYELIYDSLNEGLEPIYFWMVDFMKDSRPAGLGLDVWKGLEESEASVTSGYFGEIGQRVSLMQQKTIDYLGLINNIIKSILNLIYDLREFEMRLAPYDKLNKKESTEDEKKEAIFSLKGLWMDQVDARKGRGSINLLVQDLQFVTLRDAFFYVTSAEQVKNLDFNERVKNILVRKISEFLDWKERSEKEIRQRYEIEKTYLKSQAGTLRLYANWVKPYLIAAQKLKMKGSSPQSLMNPNIVNAFSNMEIEIKLYGKREIKADAVHDTYKGIELAIKHYILIEIILKFRSIPSTVSGQGGRHYVHGGRTNVTFKGFVVDNLELEAIENLELLEDLQLIDDYIGTSLNKLQEDIEKYDKPEIKKEEKVKRGIDNPFSGIFDGFKELFDPLKELTMPKKGTGKEFIYKDIKKEAESSVKSLTYVIYNTYKKTHGMINV